MPVFTETVSSGRDLRILPSFAPPLPRLTPLVVKDAVNEAERYEVVVIGVSRTMKICRRVQKLTSFLLP